MSELKINSFTEYNLTDEEQLRGSIFNELQRQVMQNHLASYAEQKNTLDFDPEHPLLFAQNEASIKAKIELLTYLLDTSIVSLDALTNQTYTSE